MTAHPGWPALVNIFQWAARISMISPNQKNIKVPVKIQENELSSM
jgi:hypothetical protein